MSNEIKDCLRREEATRPSCADMPRELLSRLRYIAAIIADAGLLADGPQLLYRTLEKKMACVKIGQELVVGRQKPADLVLGDDKRLSRKHFRICCGANGDRIEDLRSHNGTYVNGTRIESRLLCDGDLIEAGRQVFVFLRRESEVVPAKTRSAEARPSA